MLISKRTISLMLSLISVAGVGLTGFLSVKGHEQSIKVEDKKEKTKKYIPAIIAGTVTSACILGSYGISRKEIVALTATCGYLTANKDSLEKAIKNKFGDDQLKEIKKETFAIPGKRYIEDSGNGNLLCFEENSGRLFWSSVKAVTEAERKLTERFRNGHRICMNDFYAYLNIEQTTYGENFGWIPELDQYSRESETFYPAYMYDDNPLCFDDRFEEDVETGKPVYIISMYNYPVNNWSYEC